MGRPSGIAATAKLRQNREERERKKGEKVREKKMLNYKKESSSGTCRPLLCAPNFMCHYKKRREVPGTDWLRSPRL